MKLFTSEECADSDFSRKAEGKSIEDIVCNNAFWDSVHHVANILESIYGVLRMVDGDKWPTIESVYEAIRLMKEHIKVMAPRSFKAYCKIIDDRWTRQIKHPLHLAGMY